MKNPLLLEQKIVMLIRDDYVCTNTLTNKKPPCKVARKK